MGEYLKSKGKENIPTHLHGVYLFTGAQRGRKRRPSPASGSESEEWGIRDASPAARSSTRNKKKTSSAAGKNLNNYRDVAGTVNRPQDPRTYRRE